MAQPMRRGNGIEMSHMRILVACTHSAIVGGVETYLRDLIPGLRKRGHAVALLSSNPLAPNATPIVPADPELPMWSMSGSNRDNVFRSIDSWKPDLVFLHGMASPDDEATLSEAYPTVFFAHGHSSTCISGTRTHLFPTPRPCHKQFGAGCLFHYFPRRCGGLNPLTMIDLYRQARQRVKRLPEYRAVIVASRSMAEEYRHNGVPEDRLHIVPLYPAPQNSDPIPLDRAQTSRVLYVSRLYTEKGARLIVRAMAMASEKLSRLLTLVVAGDGPERSVMEAQAKQWTVPIEFHGWVNGEERARLMREADVLVVPSVCPETFGLVGVEAGSLGLPAVGFAVGGIPDWLESGKSGELAPGDPPRAAAFADALVRALKDFAYLQSLRAGALYAAQQFSAEKHLSAVEQILARIAQQTV